jgi:hypothetical protein
MEIACARDCNSPATAVELPDAFQEVIAETDFRLYVAYVDLRGVWRDAENQRPIFGVTYWYEANEQASTFARRFVAA